MKSKYFSIIILAIFSILFVACEKQTDNVKVTYRIIYFQDGFEVLYRHDSDSLFKQKVEGVYTLATPWIYSFEAKKGDILYVSMKDTIINSYSRVQILIDGKIYKEKARTQDRLMPVTVSGVVPYN